MPTDELSSCIFFSYFKSQSKLSDPRRARFARLDRVQSRKVWASVLRYYDMYA